MYLQQWNALCILHALFAEQVKIQRPIIHILFVLLTASCHVNVALSIMHCKLLERRHLLAFLLRLQGIFFNAYFLAYILSPKTCHAFVGYLEEEAVKTYTHAIADIDKGCLPEWSNKKACCLPLLYPHVLNCICINPICRSTASTSDRSVVCSLFGSTSGFISYRCAQMGVYHDQSHIPLKLRPVCVTLSSGQHACAHLDQQPFCECL